MLEEGPATTRRNAMSIAVVCDCGKRLRVADDLRGKKVRCPGCKAVLTAGESDGPAPPQRAKAPGSAPKAKHSRVGLFLLLGCGCLGLATAGGGAVLVVLLIALNSVTPSTAARAAADRRSASGGAPPGAPGTGSPSPGTGSGTGLADLKVTPLDVDAQGLLPCLTWADGAGNAFLAGDGNQAMLYRFSGPDYRTKQAHNLGVKPSWLSWSADGLVVTVADRSEVRVLDPATFAVTRTIPVPQLKRAVSAPSLSVAVAGTGVFDAELVVVDLRTGEQTKVAGPKRLGKLGYGQDPMMAPDGRSLYTNGLSGSIVRWDVSGKAIAFASVGPRMHAGSAYPITVSADSRYVAEPCAAGNSDAGKSYSTLVMDAALQRHCVLDIGTYPAPVGFDVVNNVIYTGTGAHALVTYDLGSGVKKKEYGNFGKGSPRQYLVHPSGKRFVELQQEALSYVEVKN
jgi:hypothetical protein